MRVSLRKRYSNLEATKNIKSVITIHKLCFQKYPSPPSKELMVKSPASKIKKTETKSVTSNVRKNEVIDRVMVFI
jgi:glycogen synthase